MSGLFARRLIPCTLRRLMHWSIPVSYCCWSNGSVTVFVRYFFVDVISLYASSLWLRVKVALCADSMRRHWRPLQEIELMGNKQALSTGVTKGAAEGNAQ